jgi:excisionase family DNA binding protein
LADQHTTSETRYLRTFEVAALLHVAPKTVTRWAVSGKLACIKTLGGHRRYPEDDVHALVRALRSEAANGPAGDLDGGPAGGGVRSR